MLIFYSGPRIASLIQSSHCITTVRNDACPLALCTTNSAIQISQYDHHNSPLSPAPGFPGRYNFCPYGFTDTRSIIPIGYRGEYFDTRGYLLGLGYRFYNPSLRRFNSSDSLSPFDIGGINGYAYASGNPVNKSDPTGHVPVHDQIVKLIQLAVIKRGALRGHLLKHDDGITLQINRTDPFNPIDLPHFNKDLKHITREALKSKKRFTHIDLAIDPKLASGQAIDETFIQKLSDRHDVPVSYRKQLPTQTNVKQRSSPDHTISQRSARLFGTDHQYSIVYPPPQTAQDKQIMIRTPLII
ncbi:hypothetical protein D3C76_718640 [compost metagenome]